MGCVSSMGQLVSPLMILFTFLVVFHSYTKSHQLKGKILVLNAVMRITLLLNNRQPSGY